jgi:hypothetical protein
MTGKKSRQKGRTGENDWAKKTGGERISEAGMPGPDVKTPGLWFGPHYLAEVKRPAKIVGQLREYIEQMEGEGADHLAFREDRGEWYVVLKAEPHMYVEIEEDEV